MLTTGERIATFEEELGWMPDARIRHWTEECILKFPEYIFHVGASDSNSHHPLWDLGEGGCVRHIRAVTRLANMECGTYLADIDDADTLNIAKSRLLAACILHDSFKYGVTFDLRSYIMHPYIPRSILGRVEGIDPAIKESIFRCVESHMGSIRSGGWDLLPYITKAKLERDPIAHLVHTCDYLASNASYSDPRFAHINEGIDPYTLGHYEPFADGEIRGLILGGILKYFGNEAMIASMADGTVDAIFARVVALKSNYAKRKINWNYETIVLNISTISRELLGGKYASITND